MFLETLIDTLKILPILFLVFWIGNVAGDRIRKPIGKILRYGSYGPLWGALLGSIPQCGFSVIGTALWMRKDISTGTLISLYIATSDEAIPVLLTNPRGLSILLPLIFLKIILGTVIGIAIDRIWMTKHIASATTDHAIVAPGCCGEHVCVGDHDHKENWAHSLIHPLVHTLKIGLILFVVTLLLGFILQSNLFALSPSRPVQGWLGVIVAIMIGIIPNCAASVIIAQGYIASIFSFGTTMAGLCASAGLGPLLLLGEKRYRDLGYILTLLLGSSFFIGIILNSFA
jgi:hypothetical protein